MLKLYVERGRIEETATNGRRDIPGGCGCVHGVQEGSSSGSWASRASRSLVGVKRDVAEEISVNEEDLLGLVTFHSKESIQDVVIIK